MRKISSIISLFFICIAILLPGCSEHELGNDAYQQMINNIRAHLKSAENSYKSASKLSSEIKEHVKELAQNNSLENLSPVEFALRERKVKQVNEKLKSSDEHVKKLCERAKKASDEAKKADIEEEKKLTKDSLEACQHQKEKYERLDKRLKRLQEEMRQEKERRNEERLEQERLEQQRGAQQRLEQQRRDRERREQQRLEQERRDRERLEQQRRDRQVRENLSQEDRQQIHDLSEELLMNQDVINGRIQESLRVWQEHAQAIEELLERYEFFIPELNGLVDIVLDQINNLANQNQEENQDLEEIKRRFLIFKSQLREKEVTPACYIPGAHELDPQRRDLTPIIHPQGFDSAEHFKRAIEDKCREYLGERDNNYNRIAHLHQIRRDRNNFVGAPFNLDQNLGQILVNRGEEWQTYTPFVQGQDKFKKTTNVQYRNEPGIDAGGLRREFKNEVIRDVVNAFTPNGERHEVNENFNDFQKCTIQGEEGNKENCWQNIGRLFAKMVFVEQVPMFSIKLPYPILLKLQNRDPETLVEHLALYKLVNPDMFSGRFQAFQVAENEIEDLFLDFPDENGNDIDVTAPQELFDYTLYEISNSLDKEEHEHFVNGFRNILNPPVLENININNLKLLFEGNPFTLQDVVNKMSFENAIPQNIRGWFRESVRELYEENEEFLSNLLRFWTGSSLLPQNENLNIHRTWRNNDGQLIESHTCFYQINIPIYSSKDVLKQRLRTSVEHGVIGYEQG